MTKALGLVLYWDTVVLYRFFTKHDFHVSQGSVKTLFAWGRKRFGLHWKSLFARVKIWQCRRKKYRVKAF